MRELPQEHLDSAEGFVLAGGRSSRMGADKALLMLAGKPLIQLAFDCFSSAGIPARIAGSRSPLGAFGEEIPDTFSNVGPLGGVHAAIAASAAEWFVFLPVDMPFMPGSLLDCLLRRARITGAPVTATQVNGRVEPFPVVLHRLVQGTLTAHLETGQTACHAAWRSFAADAATVPDVVSAEALVQVGQCQHDLGLPVALWFHSANTPADLLYLNRVCRIFKP